MGGGIDYGLVIDVVALSLAGVLMMRMVSRLDPRPAKPNDAKRAAVAERLLRGREGTLVLRDHEVRHWLDTGGRSFFEETNDIEKRMLKEDAKLEELCRRQLEIQQRRDEARDAFWAEHEEPPEQPTT